MVITAISLLYLSNVADTGVQWFFLKKTVIANGETRDTAFAALSQIADGLLVWRCYHVWGKSFRVIFPSLVLVVAETAILNADNYSGALLLITAGMAPTIMVARVAMQASGRAEDVRTAHISDLEFRGHSRPSGNTSQILSHGLHAQVGGRDDEYSDGRDSEKRLGGPISASAEAPLEET
ncbi:hypothetical protein HYPSUDRAFT_57828 [Hypholoma sublateritium FD-334 SS-4]|uniref:Uncharacterized protein n=1 Tax=Hypholoma sublateritium (strain FD-334 SS-4) TaxID=945553 RepID=A0A0D2KRF7_HYPSF|nr:hypothetical protein HYPSUDRAFT_57828 [Hypholoma sublateritium FD-334 SS-4]